MIAINSIYSIFWGLDGEPLQNGYVYIGEPNENPETAPVSVYWDIAGTQGAAQPLRTSNGFLYRTGTPANVFVGGDYSITVRDQSRSLVFTAASAFAAGISPSPYQIVPVQMFGAVGDGVTDDTAALTRAIASGEALYWGDSTLSYRIVTKLTFNQDQQYNRANGARMLFDGTIATRLLDVTADDVTFDGIVFDGNNLQAKWDFVQVDASVERPRFLNCAWENMTGSLSGTVVINGMYGLAISPYAVKDFIVHNCRFSDIIKYNTTAVVITPTVGWGEVGGIIFLTDNLDYATAQPTPTNGVISNCYFENIRTVLDGSLSVNNQIELQDADAIRSIGQVGGVTHLNVQISNMIVVDVAKRALKFNGTAGVQVKNLKIICTSAMQYQMISGASMGSDDLQLDGLQIFSPAASPIRLGWQSLEANRLQISNVVVQRCLSLWDLNPVDTAAAIVGYRISNIEAECEDSGIRTAAIPASFTDCSMENVVLRAKQGVVDMNALEIAVDVDGFNNWEIDNLHIVNGDWKLGQTGWHVTNSYQEINASGFTGSSTTRLLFELGQNPGGTVINPSSLTNFTLDVTALADTWFTTPAPDRADLWSISGDAVTVDNLTVVVPETLLNTQPTYSHGTFYGHDFAVRDLTYSGKGWISWLHTAKATYGPYKRCTIDGAIRNGALTADTSFLYLGDGQRCVVQNVADERIASAGSVTVSDGTVLAGDTHAWIIGAVQSATSSAGSPVYGADIATAIVQVPPMKFNQTLPTVVSAATTTLPIGDVILVTATNNINSITASWAGRRVTLVIADVLTIADGSNLVMAGNFVTTANDTITYVCDGTNWIEETRSVN